MNKPPIRHRSRLVTDNTAGWILFFIFLLLAIDGYFVIFSYPFKTVEVEIHYVDRTHETVKTVTNTVYEPLPMLIDSTDTNTVPIVAPVKEKPEVKKAQKHHAETLPQGHPWPTQSADPYLELHQAGN